MLSSDGLTALMIATAKGNIEIVKALLDDGANPDIIDCNGKTALFYAQKNKFDEIINVLMAYKIMDYDKSLMDAAAQQVKK